MNNDIIFIQLSRDELKSLIERSVQKAIKAIDTPPLKDKLFTLPEAAEYCKMAVPTFRTHLAKREVSGSKPGKAWVFTQKDLDNFIEKFRHKTADEIETEVDGYLSHNR